MDGDDIFASAVSGDAQPTEKPIITDDSNDDLFKSASEPDALFESAIDTTTNHSANVDLTDDIFGNIGEDNTTTAVLTPQLDDNKQSSEVIEENSNIADTTKTSDGVVDVVVEDVVEERTDLLEEPIAEISVTNTTEIFDEPAEQEINLNDDSETDVNVKEDSGPPPAVIKPVSQPSAVMTSLEELEKEDSTAYILDITVSEPTKNGDGMASYISYKVTTKTNLPYFKKKLITVDRRFSDFLGLYEKLKNKFCHSGRVVPPAPEKSIVGMTRTKISQDPQEGSSADFIERRRAALERYLVRTAMHPVLRSDPDFRDFLQTEGEMKKSTSTSALSGAGVMRLFNKVGETVNKMTYKMDETDAWFEEKTQQIDAIETQMKKLHSSVEALCMHRRELCNNTASFARSAAMLSNCEEHTALSRVLTQLSEVEEKVEQLHSEQANADFYLLSELLKDYISLLGAVKDVFHERVKACQIWQHAEQTLVKKREIKVKLELQSNAAKVQIAQEEVTEWEVKVERSKENFESVSKMIKTELVRFDEGRERDFRINIIKYIEALMGTQQKMIKYWESFLPEAKSIA